jgi:hypothetical protein
MQKKTWKIKLYLNLHQTHFFPKKKKNPKKIIFQKKKKS